VEQERRIPAARLLPALDALGLDFLVGILRVETSRHPANLAALAELGHVLARARRFEEGLDVDRELARRRPAHPTVHYNLACSLALLGRTEESLDALERAIELGFENAAHLLADEDLASLREEPRFLEIVRALESRAGADPEVGQEDAGGSAG